ncbi:MAG: hypothetical protein IPL60_12130 [Ardenticatenia bacterium]|nr:hypothetical protein [Ardenticatenia bacterium]
MPNSATPTWPSPFGRRRRRRTCRSCPSPASRSPTLTSAAPRRSSRPSSAVGPLAGFRLRRRGPSTTARDEIRPAELSLAVVVQRLVPAEVAGILFTANPLSGARDEVMINAAWGWARPSLAAR